MKFAVFFDLWGARLTNLANFGSETALSQGREHDALDFGETTFCLFFEV